MNKLNNEFNELQRKAMQSVKAMAQSIRVEVQDQKNAAF